MAIGRVPVGEAGAQSRTPSRGGNRKLWAMGKSMKSSKEGVREEIPKTEKRREVSSWIHMKRERKGGEVQIEQHLSRKFLGDARFAITLWIFWGRRKLEKSRKESSRIDCCLTLYSVLPLSLVLFIFLFFFSSCSFDLLVSVFTVMYGRDAPVGPAKVGGRIRLIWGTRGVLP